VSGATGRRRRFARRQLHATGNPARYIDPRALDPDAVYPANRQETLPVALMALTMAFLALAVSAKQQYMMLYGDAVAHMGIARRIVDTNSPGLVQLGSPWLPLPHLLMLPFIWKMEWWQDGMAGAWPSLVCFVLAVAGLYRLARRMMSTPWAFVAAAFFGLNANLLYLSTTAMTEPLFLALLVWIVLVTCELLEYAGEQAIEKVTNHLVLLGMLILAAVMTRYDGWILGAAVWCLVAWQLARRRKLWAKVLPGFVTFTLLTVAGPCAWFGYNHAFGHDWLDFMRGPYSAKEIDRRTSPPGSHHYFGWHDPAWSLMLYARTAQVDASAWETGWLVAAASLWGLWKGWRLKIERGTSLLWLPLPFYVYSVSYGSVPIFIPQLYPHSFYNSRYGMEMLPAFAVFTAFALYKIAAMLKSKQPLVEKFMQPVALMLCVLNLLFMLHSVPLVLKEAMVNSRGRLAFETPLAEQLSFVPRGAPILMDNSEYVGALQTAGIPLKQTIGPADYYGWRAAMQDPAKIAAYVVSVEGDAISHAVKEHPQGLTEVTIVCATDKPCMRIYRSTEYGGK
jgi:4-amino-4-deoxy-L-arabinose transferase-like glycosyltransferase